LIFDSDNNCIYALNSVKSFSDGVGTTTATNILYIDADFNGGAPFTNINTQLTQYMIKNDILKT
jgi:hypothetical protein